MTEIIAEIVEEEEPDMVLLADWLKDHPEFRSRQYIPNPGPMFRGFDVTGPQPRSEPLAAERDPEPPDQLDRQSRLLYIVVAIGVVVALIAMGLAMWMTMGGVCVR